MNFTSEQQKIIYNAVRYYQINSVPVNSKQYSACDEILNAMFKDVRLNYVEPAYEVQSTSPTNEFGVNV
jgi:hypothetical protein